MSCSVIGIHGAAGAGKGVVASLLRPDAEIAFADPIYSMIAAMTGIPVARLKDRSFKEATIPGLGVSPRRLLQTLGTEWGRDVVREDLWRHLAESRIEAAIQGGARHVAVPDVRFDDEADLIHAVGGVVWRVTRPGAATCAPHSSESGISPEKIDLTIDNSGTLEDLREAVLAALGATPAATMKDTAWGHLV